MNLGEIIGLKEKLLSKSGKEILLKTMVQAIPTYEYFLYSWWFPRWNPLTNGLFLVGIYEEHALEVLGAPTYAKEHGGMGLRNLKIFNKAFPNKFGGFWRVKALLPNKFLNICIEHQCWMPEEDGTPASLGNLYSGQNLNPLKVWDDKLGANVTSRSEKMPSFPYP